ncbi:type IV pilus assembly protein PilM [bacterium]|nr:type IV pilus assembly protein PilM [bacterium]
MRLFGGKGPAITNGLDIGTSYIKLVRLQHLNEIDVNLLGYGLKKVPRDAIVEKEIRDHDTVLGIIQSLIDEVDPSIKEVSISLAGRRVFTDKFQVKVPKKRENLRESIMIEAEQKLPMGTEGLIIDYHILHESEDSKTAEILMVAVHNDFLRDYVLLMQDGGYSVVGVDVDYIALTNALKHNIIVNPEDSQVIVDIGNSITNLTFLLNGAYFNVRDITGGTLDIWKTIQMKLRVSPEELSQLESGEATWPNESEFQNAVYAATEELKMGLDMAFSYFENITKGNQISQLYLAGGGSIIPYLGEVLSEKLSLTYQVLNPFYKLHYDPSIFVGTSPEAIAPLFSVAVGLGLRKD